MTRGAAERIETGVDVAAAALLGAAMFVALSAFAVPLASGGAVAAFVACAACLRAVRPAPRTFGIADFPARAFKPEQLPELVLLDADRLLPVAGEVRGDEELVLDDILAEIGPDARVVRLFDPAAMLSPDQLKDRIDRHLDGVSPPTAPPDASQALFDALAQLRSSLR